MKPKILKQDREANKKLVTYAHHFCVEHQNKVVFTSPYLKKANAFYEGI